MKHFKIFLILFLFSFSAAAQTGIYHFSTFSDLNSFDKTKLTTGQVATASDNAGKLYIFNGTTWGEVSPTGTTARVDSFIIFQDSILITYDAGAVETFRDTIPASPSFTDATKAEAEAGTVTANRNFSPLRIKEAIEKNISRVDSVTLFQDSILISYNNTGTELKRDTIRLDFEKPFPFDTASISTLSNPVLRFNNAKDTIVVIEATAATAITINSNLAAVALVLPASAVAGSTIFYVNDSVLINQATLTVQTGETLNGEVNGIFYFSNYPKGAEFMATEVSGGWSVLVVGVSVDGESIVYDMDLTDITATNTTLSIGTNPADETGTALHDDGTATITRIGDKAICTLTITNDDDSAIDITLGTSIVPTGGKIISMSVNGFHRWENSSTIVTSSGNIITVDRSTAINADLIIELTFITDGWEEKNQQILAGMVVPEKLSFGTVYLDSGSGITTVCPIDATTSESEGLTPTGLGFTVDRSGRYHLTPHASLSSVTQDVTIKVNGVTKYTFSDDGNNTKGSGVTLNLVNTDVITLETDVAATWANENTGTLAEDANASRIIIIPVATSTVVMPTESITVDDQATSGYMDIGEMRIQWGIETQTVAGGEIQTFPQPFKTGTVPVITANYIGGSRRGVSLYFVTPTGYTSYLWDATGTGSNVTGTYQWQAIGVKP